MKLKAFREYKPTKDTVEVTLYWRDENGKKMRHDFDLPYDIFMWSEPDTELILDFAIEPDRMINERT